MLHKIFHFMRFYQFGQKKSISETEMLFFVCNDLIFC